MDKLGVYLESLKHQIISMGRFEDTHAYLAFCLPSLFLSIHLTSFHDPSTYFLDARAVSNSSILETLSRKDISHLCLFRYSLLLRLVFLGVT